MGLRMVQVIVLHGSRGAGMASNGNCMCQLSAFCGDPFAGWLL